MTTAVIVALLHYLVMVSLPKAQQQKSVDLLDLDTVHVIAQSAHCIAQGKVGSGFDVSSAVYGSQRYVRFSPEVLSSTQATANALPLEEVIGNVLRGKWDHERTKFFLPPLMNLPLEEPGTGGSSAPSMVGTVKNWQKLEPEKSKDTWRNLSEANSKLERQLNILSSFAESDWGVHRDVIDQCSSLKSEKRIDQAVEPNKEAVVKSLLGARDAMIGIRNLIRQMGEAAGVTIEPELQTLLLDATMNMEGVLSAGVPGAGGFDAIFAVTLVDSSNKVTSMELTWCPCHVGQGRSCWCLSRRWCDPISQELTTAVSTVTIS